MVINKKYFIFLLQVIPTVGLHYKLLYHLDTTTHEMFTYGIVFASVMRQSFPGVIEYEDVLPADVVDTFIAVRIELRWSGAATHHHASFRGDRLLAQHSHLKWDKNY